MIFFIGFNIFCGILTILPSASYAANILFLLGMSSPSHHIWNSVIVYGLAEKNHNITVVAIDIEPEPPANVHYIHLEKVYERVYQGQRNTDGFNMMDMINLSPFTEMSVSMDYCAKTCEAILQTNGIKTILNYPDTFKFEAVVYDYTCGPCLLFLLKKFNYPPLISITAFSNPSFTVDLVGGHKHHAYIPFYGLPFGQNMTFWQRSYNLLFHIYTHFYRHISFAGRQDAIVKKAIKMDFEYLGHMEERSVLAIVNTHPAVDFPEPLPPNVIEAGGLHIQEAKNLPSDLERFINQSVKGAVLFSLGTNVKSDMLGADIQTRFLKAFEQLPNYHFLWKFETDTLPMEPPKNVLVRPWLPQNDILGHLKVKAFITHSGALSTMEASWHGVPIIGIPFIVDQHKNIIRAVETGVAEKLTYPLFTTDEIRNKLLLVLENPSYRENMKLRSKRFKDQKEPPLERAIWWIEWILRHPQPDHILSPVLQLGFISGNCLDIYIFFTLIILASIYIFYQFIQIIDRIFFRKVKMD